MKYSPILASVLCAQLAILGCADDTKFASGNAAEAKAGSAQGTEAGGGGDDQAGVGAGDEGESVAGETPPTEPTASGAAKCDLTKDLVTPKFPDKIQTCINTAHIFNFYTDSCSEIELAKSFECSFAGVRKAMTALGISTSAVEAAEKGKAKLVGCGEKRDGKTIVTQWWYPTAEQIEESSCTATSSTSVTTGCFQQDTGDGTITDAKTPEERAEIIKKCLQ